MPARKYTDAQLDEAARLREAGKSYGEIERRTGIHQKTAYWHCLRLGADAPPEKRLATYPSQKGEIWRGGHLLRRFTPEEDRKMVDMELAGAGPAAIARAIGRRHNSVMGRLMTLARRDARQEERHG